MNLDVVTQAAAGPVTGAVRRRLLIADDEPMLLRNMSRYLNGAGFDVETANNGRDAAALVRRTKYDAIISDIDMPGLTGIELLRAIRSHDLDVPVILMTGAPDHTTASEAVEFGALRYLTKPVKMEEICRVAEQAVRLRLIAEAKLEALALGGGGLGLTGRATLEAAFARAMKTLWMAYQPVVHADGQSVFGYEALLRTDEPALPNPGAVLHAAERLERLHDLGARVRDSAAAAMANAPERGVLFVNLHTRDLLDDSLCSATSPLSKIANRVVLEITERASLDEVKDAAARVAKLRSIGFRIAIDDLGAGYAGLTSFAILEPQLVKLDMSLVRDIDRNTTKQKIVRTMITLCKEMGVLVVGEGVETRAERSTLVELGCDLLQGYLFAKPGRPFPSCTL